MDIAKLKRLPLSRLRVLAQQHGIADVEGLDRKALLQVLATLTSVDSSTAETSPQSTELPLKLKSSLPGQQETAAIPSSTVEMASPNGEAETPAKLLIDSEGEAREPARQRGESDPSQAEVPSKPKRKRIRRAIPVESSEVGALEGRAPELSSEAGTAPPASAVESQPLPPAKEGVPFVPAEGGEVSATPEAPSSQVAEPAPLSAPRLSLSELFEKLRIPVQGVFVPVERQSHGYLRSALYNYHASPDDVYVPVHIIRQYNLRWGDTVEGKVRLPRENERAYTLVEVERVNGLPPQYLRERRSLEYLTALFPTERFRLSDGTDDLTLRMIDLFAPIGKGQRGLIVAPPKTGKTIILQKIANAILHNHPEVYMIVLLVDERPEEVTEFARNVPAEVVASTFDEEPARQIELAETVIEKAKRLAEAKLDVVVLMDSITRLARAYNHATPVSGRILTGGMDSAALHKPKRFFGAARKIEEGGSLTIVATALIDTGSKMDEVVFEEYKGTGNMELKLDRRLADRRIFPAINILESGTRHEEALLPPDVLARVWAIRKFLAELKPDEATEFLLDRMRHTRTNQELLEVMSRWSP